MGVMKPELVMKAVIPVIFAGIIGIYGLIVCVILLNHSMSFLPCNLYSAPPPSCLCSPERQPD